MEPTSERVIRFNGQIITTGSRVSVKMSGREEPQIGRVGFINSHGFSLDMSTPDKGHTLYISFRQVESINLCR